MSSSTTLKVPLTEVKSITKDFTEANLIGKGLLGKIYEGQLSLSGKSIDVAVRRLDHSFWLQDVAFDKEITMLSGLKHDNLVSLVGICEENGEMIIINKRETRGSLSRHLSGLTLNWIKRLQISVGVASALSYLHDNTTRGYSVLHHNVNTTSILLDEKWEAKLSGFEYSMTIPIEHLDLAYEKLGIGTYKSDVFSFGIVLFEILCGTKAFISTENNKFQASLAMFHFEGRKLHELVDPDLFKQMDPQSFNIFSETAYYCLKGRQAPINMNQVLTRLKRALKLQEQYDNDEHSTVVRKGPSSNNLKLKAKNIVSYITPQSFTGKHHHHENHNIRNGKVERGMPGNLGNLADFKILSKSRPISPRISAPRFGADILKRDYF
ncbi:serine/threonine-protein kinase, active site protein [Artemisia annua]|uniref:Serine/threonine-protein kinase, active site protein n=1 Tax=Artemisia annua TaxID=35608 RepID=A0A2U1N7N4_ARTAN|nr:serine/threonine-protein kinase, active site protein [Artemisia annua]